MFKGGINLELAILLLSSVSALVIGLFTLSRNTKSATNRLFTSITVTLVTWAFISYLSLRATGNDALMDIKLTFACVVLQNAAFLLLAYTYPANKLKHPAKLYLPYVILTFVILALLPTKILIKDYADNQTLIPGPAIPLFIIHALASIISGFRQLFRRHSSGTALEKSRLTYLIAGSLILWVIVPITNFILPVVLNFNVFVRASSLYVLMFTVVIAYAIVRHRLFDIKFIVARSLAYILTLGFFITAYTAGFTLLTYTFFPDKNLDVKQLTLFVLLAVLFSPTVSVVKRFFDKSTNRLFYRDAYESQAVLSELNNVLVSSIQVAPLLNESSKVIERHLKVTFCAFAVYEDSGKIRFEGNKKLKSSDDLGLYLRRVSTSETLITEETHGGDTVSTKTMQKHGVSVLCRMSTHLGRAGFIILGPKLSGNSYSDNDIRLLKLISNELAIAVQNALRFEQIEDFNATLQEKVSTATRELRRSNEKLKALDEAKDEFISMASHQLRTPLTSVKGYLSMLDEGDAGKLNATQKQFVNQAFVSSQRMVYLIADLLNVSRLKTGKFAIEAHPIYLPDVIESEIAQLYETAKSRGLELKYDKPKTFPMLTLDETKIRQVIMNFVDNALYYTPSGGHIQVKLTQNGQMAEFTVVDDGLGVPKAEQHHLFSKFYRAGNARKVRPDGTGLGLFMAKKVVVAQNGALIFKSIEGRGSTFGFSFAIKKD